MLQNFIFNKIQLNNGQPMVQLIKIIFVFQLFYANFQIILCCYRNVVSCLLRISHFARMLRGLIGLKS